MAPFAQRNVAKFVVVDKDDGNLTISESIPKADELCAGCRDLVR
jgi:hypothetical protein